MAILGIPTFKDRKLAREREQQAVELAKLEQIKEEQYKAAVFDAANQWAQQVYSQIRWGSSLPVFDYDLAKFIAEGYIKNPHVYSVINRILEPAKTVPWLLYEIKDQKSFKRYKEFKKHGRHDEAELLARKAFEEVQGTPINKWFDEGPNEIETWPTFVEASLGYRLLTGNRFIYQLIPSGFKYPSKIYNLPAQVVQIHPGTTWRDPVAGYSLMLGMEQQKIEAYKVIHNKKFNPTFNYGMQIEDYLYGLSPLAPLCRTVKRSNEGIDAMLALMMNGIPPGILSGELNENANPFTADQQSEVKKAWAQRHGGGRRANMPVFSPIKLSWQALGLKSVDMEILEADKVDITTIAGVYRVPLPIVTNDKASYNNMTEAHKDLYNDAIIPELNALREDLNSGPIKAFNKNYWCDYDLKAVPELQEDKKARTDIALNLMEHGLMTGNEVRYLLDYDMDESVPELGMRMLRNNLRYIDPENPFRDAPAQQNQPPDPAEQV